MKRFTCMLLTITVFSASSVIAAEGSLSLGELSAELFESYESHPGFLVREAGLCYQDGDYAGAAEYYILALGADLDDNPITLFNLACCFGLLDEPELAGKALLQSALAGFDRPDLIETDTDFSSVMDDEVFNEYAAETMAVMEEARERRSMEVLGERLYLEFPSMQTTRIHFPDDYNPQDDYDLVLALHGYGGDVAEFSSRWTSFDEGNFIFVSLQAPYAFEQGGRTVYSWTVHGSSEWDGGDMPPEQKQEMFSGSIELSSDMILACLEMIKSRYSIGDVYLLGFSQGGIMAYWTGFRNPELFSGIATYSGVIDEELYSVGVIESAASLPVFIGRGTQEDDRAINTKNLLTDAGYAVTFFEYDGGHFFPEEGLRAVEDWILEIR
ncbi:MAG: alpha/beta hydrolase-fold protein [Candidatus Fermentibacteria bacterium]